MPTPREPRQTQFWQPDTTSVTGMLRVEREDRLRTIYSEHFLVVVVYEGAVDSWCRAGVHTHVAGAINLKQPGEVSFSRSFADRTRNSQHRPSGAHSKTAQSAP